MRKETHPVRVYKKEDRARTGKEEAFVRHFEDPCPFEDARTLLKRCFGTSIDVKLLSEEWARLGFALDDTSFQKGELVIDQRLLFQHGETGENLLYAASLLRPDLLPSKVRPEPYTQQMQPLGTLLQAVSVRQTLLACERQAAGYPEVEYFALEWQAPCLARMTLYSLDTPIMLVYEVIPLRTAK